MDTATATAEPQATGRKRLLHVGCGPSYTRREVPSILDYEREWEVVRVDIDPAVGPDVVADIVTLEPIADESVHMVFAKHVIEHIGPHQVEQCFRTFHRVLAPEGALVIRTPDLEQASRLVLEQGLEAVLYDTMMGPTPLTVTVHDLFYGSRQMQAEGRAHMAHRCGFTPASLRDRLRAAGFESVGVKNEPGTYEIKCTALKRLEGNLFNRGR